MTWFLILATVLLVLTAALLLIPFLRPAKNASGTDSASLSLTVLKEQLRELEREHTEGTLDTELYAKEKAEIERRAIEDAQNVAPQVAERHPQKLVAGAVAACLIAVSIGGYLYLGNPESMQTGATGTGADKGHQVTPQQIQAMVARLADRLQNNPNDAEGWVMLARSYNALGRFPEAAAAFGRAASLIPDNSQLLADYADTLAMAQGRRLAGEPEKIIQRALALDPKNMKAWALSGSAAFERKDFRKAAADWRKILELVPPESDVAARIRTSIAEAEANAGGGSVAATALPAAPAATAQAKTAAAGKVSVGGTVSLDAALRSKVADGDTVFVFARAASGPRMPLAIKRMTVRDLPAKFTLDDSMAMSGGMKLSDVKQVIVGARVSKSGDALPKPGDLEGYSEPVSPGADNLRVTISKAVP